MQQTGMERDELLATLSEHLPRVIDHLTPEGRLPTEQEASRFGDADSAVETSRCAQRLRGESPSTEDQTMAMLEKRHIGRTGQATAGQARQWRPTANSARTRKRR